MTSKFVGGITGETATKFRQAFSLPTDFNVKRWSPKHMYASLKHMQAKLRLVDCVVEVHDARIPFTGRNPLFKSTLYGIKPHVLVLNKMDLIEKSRFDSIEKALYKSDKSLRQIVWTDCKKQTPIALKNVMNAVKEQIAGVPRYNREYRSEYMIMVIGIPNVGKSSLINAMRTISAHLKGNVTPVGRNPGVTKAIMTKIAIHENPKIYVLDTPGIVSPQAVDDECWMKLALCETILQHFVGEETIVDYLLYYLNKQQNFLYVSCFNLTEPTDDVYSLLYHIACVNKLMKNVALATGVLEMKPDLTRAARKFLAAYHRGYLGERFLDVEKLDSR